MWPHRTNVNEVKLWPLMPERKLGKLEHLNVRSATQKYARAKVGPFQNVRMDTQLLTSESTNRAERSLFVVILGKRHQRDERGNQDPAMAVRAGSVPSVREVRAEAANPPAEAVRVPCHDQVHLVPDR